MIYNVVDTRIKKRFSCSIIDIPMTKCGAREREDSPKSSTMNETFYLQSYIKLVGIINLIYNSRNIHKLT